MIGVIFTFLLASVLPVSLGSKNEKAASSADWSKAAIIMKVDDDVLKMPIGPNTSETYNPKDRYWEGLPTTVCVGHRLWSAWYTGGNGEPNQYNYLVVSYSDDNGVSWIDPYFVIDHEDEPVSLCVPNFAIEGDDLCLYYLQSYTWVIRFHNADANNINDVTYDVPVRISNQKIHKAPTILRDSDGTNVYAIASEGEVGDSHPNISKIFVSKSLKTKPLDSWKQRGKITTSLYPDNNRVFAESQIVELDFGKWLLVSRLENGLGNGIETSISSDFGKTWEPYKNSLIEPFIGPGSKGHIMRLSSGNILVINHDTVADRSSLCAYLSVDNGISFPYKMSIDHRSDVSYPFAQEKNGKIYVSWDKGRYIEKEIRLSIIDEDDIKAGKIIGNGSVDKLIINKLNPNYSEVVKVDTQFEKELTFSVGTPSSQIKESLPKTIDIVDNLGKRYSINGTWKSSGYNTDMVGTYVFSFSGNLPSNVSDPHLLLQTNITLIPKSGLSIGAITGIIVGSVVVVAGCITLFIVLRRKKHESIS